LAALNAGNPGPAIQMFERVVQLEPKHKQAWDDLGLAYLRLGKFDEAAAAFHHQLQVNPYDEHAYNYLGLTYEQQQKFSEAADSFKKQIEVNPLDTLAHAALGSLYLEQHKYAAAVPELDKATILSPDDGGLQVSLGQAYLNSGDKEKALGAFDKGVELSQAPLVWNNVAYSLADHNLQLDKAQRYAESAVATTAANLRNVELSHLTLADLGQVASIGAYWDTLGWVHFQKGDLATAERYLQASWALDQHGEVADHLAQTYEKRGQKDEAVHLYALAAAAPHSVPETRARLAKLLGTDPADPKIDALVRTAQSELPALHTFSAGKIAQADVSADFWIELAPKSSKDPAAKVEAVRFVSGSERLRGLGERLRQLDFGAVFPDESGAKLIRRATLACSAAPGGDCHLTLVRPEDVRTVN
jgi:Flp pilus assembly protein TadD